MLNLKYSKNTVGCRVCNEIYVHPELYKDEGLYKAVLAHESEHTHSFSAKDFFLDLFNDDLKGHKKAYYSFMLKHPRTFLGLLPVGKIGKYWTIDINLGIFYIVLILIGFIIGVRII